MRLFELLQYSQTGLELLGHLLPLSAHVQVPRLTPFSFFLRLLFQLQFLLGFAGQSFHKLADLCLVLRAQILESGRLNGITSMFLLWFLYFTNHSSLLGGRAVCLFDLL